MPSQRKILIWKNGDGTKRIAIERGLICALGKYLGRRVGLSEYEGTSRNPETAS